MENDVQAYKDFIDGLVTRAASIESNRVREGWRYATPSGTTPGQRRRAGHAAAPGMYERFARYNRIMDSFTDEQKEFLIGLLQGEKLAGMQEVLALLSDNRYHLTIEGTELPLEPFETSFAYDLDARYNGQPWPDERSS